MSQVMSPAFVASRAAMSAVVVEFPTRIEPTTPAPTLAVDPNGRPYPTMSTGKIEVIVYE